MAVPAPQLVMQLLPTTTRKSIDSVFSSYSVRPGYVAAARCLHEYLHSLLKMLRSAFVQHAIFIAIYFFILEFLSLMRRFCFVGIANGDDGFYFQS